MIEKIPTFSNQKMFCDAGSLSKSPGKGRPLVKTWKAAGLIDHHTSGRASLHTICMAHDPSYVADVLEGRVENGFGNTLPGVIAALPYQVQSLVDACRFVATSKEWSPVACSPTSGFHHAHYGYGHGFCTFNGLLIAAQDLVLLGMAKRVGILDCDYHFGDGTEDILKRMNLKHLHWTCGGQYTKESDAKQFLEGLATQVKLFKNEVDVLIYQAGADQHIDDPLGGMLTTEQMAQRDRTVFWVCREYRIPLVWNLAGGYQTDAAGTIQPVLDLHHQTMQQCVDIYIKGQERKP